MGRTAAVEMDWRGQSCLRQLRREHRHIASFANILFHKSGNVATFVKYEKILCNDSGVATVLAHSLASKIVIVIS